MEDCNLQEFGLTFTYPLPAKKTHFMLAFSPYKANVSFESKALSCMLWSTVSMRFLEAAVADTAASTDMSRAQPPQNVLMIIIQ